MTDKTTESTETIENMEKLGIPPHDDPSVAEMEDAEEECA